MSAINSTTGGVNSLLASGSSESTLAVLGTDDFLEIILAEMVNQDPLAPADTSATIDQLSQLWSIETDAKLADSVEAMSLQNELNTAASVIGKAISGISVDGVAVQGTVVSAISTIEGAFLRLDTGDFVAMDRVDEIVNVPVASDSDDDDSTNEENNTGSGTEE